MSLQLSDPWIPNHMIVPGIAIWMYLDMPVWKRELENIPKSFQFRFAIVHNFLLSAFSGFIFYEVSKSIFITHGIIFQHEYFFREPWINTMMWLVYLSKYYEFMDTILLYAAGKKPIFLQKFHHVGAVVIWHLAYVHKCDFIVFVSWLNCGVHTIMYTYYLASLFTKKIPKLVKQSITSMQIGQLACGPLILPLGYYYTETSENYKILMLFSVYIFALLYLFGEFMVNTYFIRV
jgi:hypothetical protein